jgi:uncharacterized membrane protein YeaQ/YmgE (transglycosylase-associated protein family)
MSVSKRKPAAGRHGGPREVDVIYRERNAPKPTMGYILLNAAFSTIFTLIMYFAYIMPRPKDIVTFFLLWLLNYISGIVGSVCARMLTANYHDFGVREPAKFHDQQIISALIYTVIVWIGFYNFIVIRYIDMDSTSMTEFLEYLVSPEFLEIVAVLFALKLGIYLSSDFLAQKMTGG